MVVSKTTFDFTSFTDEKSFKTSALGLHEWWSWCQSYKTFFFVADQEDK